MTEVLTANHDLRHRRWPQPRAIMQRKMSLPGAHHRLLRIAPLVIWALFGTPFLIAFLSHPHGPFPHGFWLFLGSFGAFGVSFWANLKTGTTGLLRPTVALLVQSAAVLTMSYFNPEHLIGLLFVFISWQLTMFFKLPVGIAWIAVQSFLLLLIYARAFTLGQGLAAMGINVGFQGFAVITALVAKSEIRAREDLARVNAELRATRELLAEGTRINERTRISRELHDVMGHNLTALSIHLEVASHLTSGPAQEHLQKARSLSKALLQDVRETVSAARDDDRIDLKRALEVLCEGIPNLQLHTTFPCDLVMDDPNKAQVFLRCVQEIVTNALRHSQAQNLWITVSGTDRGFEINARDDGRGSAHPKPGLGLSSMRARLEEIGGRLSIESEPARGFAVTAWLPSAAK